ncbi:MAG: tRNA 4-thiouridine(8) synthase ThiI [Candidatus Brocadiia bacterium]
MPTEHDHKAPAAVLLFSGGLDSILAAELLRRAGVEVILLRHRSIFYPLKEGGYVPPCPCIVRDVSEEMVRLVQEPQYGFGKNVNPCLDCKQMMYGKAMSEARRRGAGFIATGEVLGQRPMSQRRDTFRRMEKGAGVVDLVVRPLSGKLLPPTIPEREGLIAREDMLDIQGRSRKRQMALAEQWGIEEYPGPAGGCRLTDPHFAERAEALREMGYLELEHLRAVRNGRFFVLGERTYALVGRNHEDNMALLADAPPACRMLDLDGRPGPLAALMGEPDEQQLEQARRLVIRYSRFDGLPTSEVLVETPEQCRRRKAAGEDT